MKYTRDVLAPIVASSRSLAEVIRRLGLRPTGGNHRFIASRVRQAELDTSHFTYGRGGDRYRVPLDQLARLVEESTSVAQVCAKLGFATRGRPHRELTSQIIAAALDTTHFRGRGWSRGETAVTHPSVASTARHNTIPDDQLFIENAPYIQGPKLLKRLLARGWEYRCLWCGINEWRGLLLVLHVDHINGIPNDNRIENLRLLCPNCHSQTDTYCNKRR